MSFGKLQIDFAKREDVEMVVEIAPREHDIPRKSFSVDFIKFSVVRHNQFNIRQQPEGKKWTQHEILLLSTELLLTDKENRAVFLATKNWTSC